MSQRTFSIRWTLTVGATGEWTWCRQGTKAARVKVCLYHLSGLEVGPPHSKTSPPPPKKSLTGKAYALIVKLTTKYSHHRLLLQSHLL